MMRLINRYATGATTSPYGVIVLLLLFGICSSAAYAEPADIIQVLKIAAQDERAVIKDTDGRTRVIKPGDSVGTAGKVSEIAADRVVLEEKRGNETEKVIIRLIDGKQTIERLKKTWEKQPQLIAPHVQEMKKQDMRGY